MRLTPLSARSAHVGLEPIAEAHRKALRAAAADPELWRWWPRDMSDFDAVFDSYLSGAAGWMAHTVSTPTGEIVGQTCYLNVAPEHARVEIGSTWYAAPAQGTAINPAAKLLMIDHAFACGAERVELKTDARNARSRAAILKLGASFEGIHRRHMRLPDGSFRDTAWYSVIFHDWPAVKAGLERRLDEAA